MAKFGLAALAAAMLLTGAAGAQEAIEPGWVKGKATDKAGNPLAGVVIFMDGYSDNNLQFTTQADGTYRIRLQPGAYKALAWYNTTWDGQAFKIDLKPDTTDTLNDTDGAIRNFTWELTGSKIAPDMGSYGAYLYVNVGSDNFFVEDQDNITYTLTPSGPLIDGSAGEVITRKGGAPRTAEWGKILDIPVGRYTITGVYAPPGKQPQTLRFRNAWARNPGEYAESLEFGIQAEGNYCSNCASIDIESPVEPQAQ